MSDDFDLAVNLYPWYFNKIGTIYLGHTRAFASHGFQSNLPKQTKIAACKRTLCKGTNHEKGLCMVQTGTGSAQ